MNDTLAACAEAMKALNDAIRNRFEPIPKGWFTANQFAESQGVGRSESGKRIARGLKLGVFERQQWSVYNNNRPVKLYIYRVKRAR